MKKRIILTAFWIGETVYARADGERGLITMVQICTDRLVPRYYVVMSDRVGEWCDEMELSAERLFPTSASESTETNA